MSIDTTKVDLSMSGSQTSSAQGSSKLGKDEFLKILTAQLANQDPTQPMDSNAFVAQLAQFSALEQQQNTNDTLTQMLSLQESASGSSAVSMVGKDALYNPKQMDLASGGSLTVNATLPSDAANVTMTVSDSNGNPVCTQDFGPKSAGTTALTWDGKDNSGVAQAAGTYSIAVSAVDISGKTMTVSEQARGRITGVTFASGTPELLIGNTSISLSDVQSIQESSNSK